MVEQRIKGYEIKKLKKMANSKVLRNNKTQPIETPIKEKIVKVPVEVIKYRDKIVKEKIKVPIEVIKRVYEPRPKLSPEESAKVWKEKNDAWNKKQKIKGVEIRIAKLQKYLEELKGGEIDNENLSSD